MHLGKARFFDRNLFFKFVLFPWRLFVFVIFFYCATIKICSGISNLAKKNLFLQFQGYLDDIEGRISNSPGNTLSSSRNGGAGSNNGAGGQIGGGGGGVGPNKPVGRRSSVSDGAESLSRSASDSSVTNPTLNHNKNMTTPLHSHG